MIISLPLNTEYSAKSPMQLIHVRRPLSAWLVIVGWLKNPYATTVPSPRQCVVELSNVD